jgi:hypothetical protein
MIKNFELNLELAVIKDFLDYSLKAIDNQYSEIFKKDDEGIYTGIDDFPNAMYSPMEQETIVIRAVMYELNAVAEWNIQNIAWSVTPKNNSETIISEKTMEPILPQDLVYGDARKIIEKHFNFQFSELPNYTEFQLLRDNVNSFKHRKGYKKFKSYLNISLDKLLERIKPSRDEAYTAIKHVGNFLYALREKTHNSYLISSG